MVRALRPLALASVLLLGACRALLDLPDVGSELATEDAGTEAAPPVTVPTPTNDASPGTTCKTYLPAEGYYAYGPPGLAVQDRGVEIVYILQDGGEPANHFKRETIPAKGEDALYARVQHLSPTSYKFRVDLTPDHYNEFTFENVPDKGLSVVSVEDGLNDKALGPVMKVLATCPEPAETIRCTMTPGAGWQRGATGSLTFFQNPPVAFGAGVAFKFIEETETFTDGSGENVPTYHVTEDRSFTGAVSRGQFNEYWFSKENGLLIKAKMTSGVIDSKKVDGVKIVAGPAIELEYKGVANFTIKDTKPIRPLDGGADAKADANY